MFDIIRVAAAVPSIAVADCKKNKEEILKLIKDAEKNNVSILNFPELCICGYTCADLFYQSSVIKACEDTLSEILEETKNIDMLITLGLPVSSDNQIFNCAAVIHKGKILGVSVKTYVPNYSEFYEKRWFAPADNITSDEITLCDQTVPWGNNILFKNDLLPSLVVGTEICEDLWSPIPPSSYMTMAGATVILNLSASNELAAKNEYRLKIISAQSASTISAYVYSSAGMGESTQDVVFSGHCVICENGSLLNQSERFKKDSHIIYSDVDIEQLVNDRRKNTTFMAHNHVFGLPAFRTVSFAMAEKNPSTLLRHIRKKPFVPRNDEMLNERCSDIFNIQVAGLAKRVMHTHSKALVIGISGGLDSTLALLVAVKTCDYLGIDRSSVLGITMPGFGTTDRTYNNALNLMKSLGITLKEISIKEAATLHFKDIDHDINVHDVTYENTQARERTQILMDIANKYNGMVIGTGDLTT